MADLAELKQMVLSFRVSELHVLLGSAGRNKSGRKQELTQRALALVQKGCPLAVQIKIRELYQQIYPNPMNKNQATPEHSEPNAMMHQYSGDAMQRRNRTSDSRQRNQSVPRYSFLCHGGNPSQMGLDYSVMGNMMLPQQHMPVNPDVKLKHLPFYDVLGELMKPSTLMPKNNGRTQENLFVFHLTPQQAQDITMSRDFRPGARCEYTVQVQVRFCLLETSCEQADTFPSQIQVRVNNRPAVLPPKPIPLNNHAKPKKHGMPIDITYLCKLNPTVTNSISVTWELDHPASFCMAIFLVRKLTSDILLGRLKQFGNRHLDHTKALIKEKLAQDPDSEIATTSLRVSLLCPLGKMRMQIPCRASTCTHLQCFDATTFLMMNERKPTWNCPVCDRPCPYDKLIIDGYFVDIFRNAPTTNDIMFHEDGTWSPMKAQKESSSQVVLGGTPKAAPRTVHASPSPPSILSLSSATTSNGSSSSKDLASTEPKKPAPSSSSSAPATAAAKAPVIDLTLDSSDEDDDDASVQNVPPRAKSPPVINLDAPSPMPASPTTVISSKSSSPVAHSPASSHQEGRPSQAAGTGRPGSHSSAHSSSAGGGRDSPSSHILGSKSLGKSSSSSSSSSAPSQPLNLEAMSDADFDDFLKGLSWGV